MTQMAEICDNKAVGAVITDRAGRYLLFSRVTYPAGFAPVEGHVDGHRNFRAAVRAIVGQECGLEVLAVTRAWSGWRGNACHRRPGPAGVGHDWRICRAEVAGILTPGAGTIAVRTVTERDLQQLANRTALYARGQVSDAGLAGRPGLEPVWVGFFHELGLVVMTPGDLALTDRLASRPASGGAP